MLVKKKTRITDKAIRKKPPARHKSPALSSVKLINALFSPALVLDKDFKIVTVNESFCQMFQVNPEEVRCQLIYELGNGAWDMPELHSLLEKVSSSDELTTGETEAESDFPVMGKKTVYLRAKKIPDANLSDRLILLAVEDVTGRKEMEEKLRFSASEWRRTFDSIQDSVILLDNDWRIMRANKAFFDAVNMKPQDLRNRKCFEIMHGTDAPVANCPVLKMRSYKKPQKAEVRGLGGVPFQVTVAPVFDEKQEVMGTVHITKDMSERKQVEEKMVKAFRDLRDVKDQLTQSEKLAAVGQLVAGVAHEINNPVGFVSGNLEVLRHYVGVYLKMLGLMVKLREVVEKKAWVEADSVIEEIKSYEEAVNLEYIIEDAEQLLRQSQEGIGRIEKIVWDLRTFAQEEVSWREEQTRIEEVLDKVLGIMRNEMKDRIEFRKSYGETPLVSCNTHKMGQVFMNLLINAGQAIREKGMVELKTYTKDGKVCVDITDTGCGIPYENLNRIFDPFFTTKPAGLGTGLGLSISHDIVKKHGGEIRVESRLGKGSTFTVLLPLPQKKAAVKAG